MYLHNMQREHKHQEIVSPIFALKGHRMEMSGKGTQARLRRAIHLRAQPPWKGQHYTGAAKLSQAERCLLWQKDSFSGYFHFLTEETEFIVRKWR